MTAPSTTPTTPTDERVLVIVVPVYKNEESLPELLDRLAALELPCGVRSRVVFVVDGSPDRSEALLRERLAHWSRPATLVVLSRNFGSFAAIRAGLQAERGDYTAVVAADLQEPPELLTSFVDELETKDVDLVLGVRSGRADPLGSRVSSRLFWWLYRRFVQPSMPPGGVDVFACNARVRDAVLEMGEANSSLVGLLMWVGFRRSTVEYERLPRKHGKSAWTFNKKVRYMLDSIFSFTDLPIRLLLFIGFFSCLAVVIAALVVIVSWAAGFVDVPGYTPLMLSILFVGGVLTLGMGIVGSYVWRTYDNTKGRPLTIERSIERFEQEAA